MRDVTVLSMVFAAAGYAVAHPYAGVLAWTWISIMNPHRLGWGFAVDFPVAMIVALATFVGIAISKDHKRWPPLKAPVVLLILFTLWMCVTSIAIPANLTAEMFSRVMKIMLMIVIAMCVLHTRRHVDLLIWVLVGSIGYYGLKGGLYTVFTGGEGRVWGPQASFIEGNNEMALAMIITIPLMRYLQLVSTKRWLRVGLGTVMIATALAAIGSQSRGALIAIAAMASVFWLRSDHKVVSGLAIAIVALAFLAFMPETWFARMGTIRVENADQSIQGRLNAWAMAWNLAIDHPIIGGGFDVNTAENFARYAPDPIDIHAAHSIYFQVLGEHGFVGLALFLAIWWNVWRWAGRLRRFGRKDVAASWARHLGGMVQVSLMGYLVGGAFLSLAYFDLPYNLLIIVVIAHGVLAELPRRSPKQSLDPSPSLSGSTAQARKYA